MTASVTKDSGLAQPLIKQVKHYSSIGATLNNRNCPRDKTSPIKRNNNERLNS